jgi:hypothetical protein
LYIIYVSAQDEQQKTLARLQEATPHFSHFLAVFSNLDL